MNILSRRVTILSCKGLFFFWLSIFALEVFFDTDPHDLNVVHTSFSISFFEYLTLFDLARFFWIGLVIIGIGAVVFAFSKYLYLVIVAAAFFLAFQHGIMESTALVVYYKSTYACHTIHSSGFQYVCPLQSLVDGHPNIPLQGDVIAPIALGIVCVSWFVARVHAGLKIALTEMIIVASAAILPFELMLRAFQPYWIDKQVLDYQRMLYSGHFTNQDLLISSATVLVCSSLTWAILTRRGFRWTRRQKYSPTIQKKYA